MRIGFIFGTTAVAMVATREIGSRAAEHKVADFRENYFSARISDSTSAWSGHGPLSSGKIFCHLFE
jgi:hypothetical protein